MPVDHQLELSVDRDLHCSCPVVRKTVLHCSMKCTGCRILTLVMKHSLNDTDRQIMADAWFAVKMVGADVVGVVWLPKFPRTSAEFPPSAAATHMPASVIS